MSQFDPFKDFRMQGHSAIVTGGRLTGAVVKADAQSLRLKTA